MWRPLYFSQEFLKEWSFRTYPPRPRGYVYYSFGSRGSEISDARQICTPPPASLSLLPVSTVRPAPPGRTAHRRGCGLSRHGVRPKRRIAKSPAPPAGNDTFNFLGQEVFLGSGQQSQSFCCSSSCPKRPVEAFEEGAAHIVFLQNRRHRFFAVQL